MGSTEINLRVLRDSSSQYFTGAGGNARARDFALSDTFDKPRPRVRRSGRFLDGHCGLPRV